MSSFDADGPGGQEPDILMLPSELVGVWANRFRVIRSPHEITVDFIRVDCSSPPPGEAILASRVAFAPLLLGELATALGKEWSAYANIPGEVPHD